MIEPLPIAFKTNERVYRQLARNGIIALYEVRNKRHILIGFELIVIRYQKAKVFPSGAKQPPKEVYPSPSQFGRFAWALPNGSRALAELCFDHLAANQPKFDPIHHCLSDKTSRKYPHTGPTPVWSTVNSFMTGRPLPKHPRWFNEPIKMKEQIEID